MISTAIDLKATGGGNDRYASQPEADAEGVDASAAPAGSEQTISIQVHRIMCSEDLVADKANNPEVYVAVEWLQDAGDDARELETPSKPTDAVIEYSGEEATEVEQMVGRNGAEIKRKLEEGKVEVSARASSRARPRPSTDSRPVAGGRWSLRWSRIPVARTRNATIWASLPSIWSRRSSGRGRITSSRRWR